MGNEVIKLRHGSSSTRRLLTRIKAEFKNYCFKRPAPTYETATTRSFYHGRTETVR